MDFQARIADATRYRDQTKGSYDAAISQTRQSQTAYDSAFNSAPVYDTIYQKYKEQFTGSQEIQDMNNDWKKAKDTVDTLRTMIDKLPTSIGQQFGGTGLTQAQRDMAKQQQLAGLNKQFTQYNADYETKFTDYSKTVDAAFDSALDVANKDYDSYWDGVRRKYDVWQTNIKNQEDWEKMYYSSQNQLQQVQLDYDNWKFQQDLIRQQREFETWLTNFKIGQANQTNAGIQASKNYGAQLDAQERARQTKLNKNQADFQSGKISSAQFLATIDSLR